MQCSVSLLCRQINTTLHSLIEFLSLDQTSQLQPARRTDLPRPPPFFNWKHRKVQRSAFRLGRCQMNIESSVSGDNLRLNSGPKRTQPKSPPNGVPRTRRRRAIPAGSARVAAMVTILASTATAAACTAATRPAFKHTQAKL